MTIYARKANPILFGIGTSLVATIPTIRIFANHTIRYIIFSDKFFVAGMAKTMRFADRLHSYVSRNTRGYIYFLLIHFIFYFLLLFFN
jgi:hypothetical protein